MIDVASSLSSLKEGEDQKEIKIEPAQAVDEVEPLPEDYYTRPINLTEGNCFLLDGGISRRILGSINKDLVFLVSCLYSVCLEGNPSMIFHWFMCSCQQRDV